MSKFRFFLIAVFFSLVFIAIIGRLFQLQILEAHKYAYKNKNKATINLPRAEIVDRNDKILALDVNKYTLEFNPLDVKEDREKLAANLNAIFPFNKKHLLYSKSSQTLAHNISRDQANKIRKLNSRLLYLHKIRLRFYPQDNLASHIIGYVDIYGEARQGIESKYNDLLTSNSSEKLVLSIDSRLQAFAEQALAQRIKETKALRGMVLVMQVHTGEILAWAVNPDFNPNKYFDYDPIRTKNWSLVDVYQPGSVFKIITVSSALDAGVIDKDYTFDDPGFLQVGKWKIKNHHYNPNKPSVEKLNLEDLFAKSSNSFASHVALKLGAKDFYHYLRKFGIGQKTGVELDGETEGILRKYNQWDPADTATTGIGQGAISITPLQLIVAVNTIANHGYKVKPTVFKVDKQKFAKQEEKKDDEKNPPIVKPEIANHVVKLLTAAIAHNVTVKKTISGNIPNVQIAGKTGTSQKTTTQGGYSHANTIASFVGFFPAQSPKYIALVVIDDPKAAGGWGDTVSGPLFNKVVSYMTSLY